MPDRGIGVYLPSGLAWGFNENDSDAACRLGIHIFRARAWRRLPEKLSARSMLPHGQGHWLGALPLTVMEPFLLLLVLHWRKVLLVLSIVLVFGRAHDAFAEPIVGRASVVDGDTIEIHGQRIRLNGIDAPESNQLCLDAKGKKYRCGQKASLALADFVDARPMTCIEVDRDRYKRIVAVCTSGKIDIAEWMVRNGHALDWPRYSNGAYNFEQEAARTAKRGMWSGSFARPWEWRSQRDAAPIISADGGS